MADLETLKIIVIGPVAVGKTSIIIRCTQNEFHAVTERTIGIDYAQKRVPLEDGTQVDVKIVDSAGEKHLSKLAIPFYRFTDGCFLVYDSSNPKSFFQMKKWLQILYENCGDVQPKVMMLANKKDIRIKLQQQEDSDGTDETEDDQNINDIGDDEEIEYKKKYISPEDGKKFADVNGIDFMETSALSGENIEKAFLKLVTDLIQEKRQKKDKLEEEERNIVSTDKKKKEKKSKKEKVKRRCTIY